jgi:hypothetical protein
MSSKKAIQGRSSGVKQQEREEGGVSMDDIQTSLGEVQSAFMGTDDSINSDVDAICRKTTRIFEALKVRVYRHQRQSLAI